MEEELNVPGHKNRIPNTKISEETRWLIHHIEALYENIVALHSSVEKVVQRDKLLSMQGIEEEALQYFSQKSREICDIIHGKEMKAKEKADNLAAFSSAIISLLDDQISLQPEDLQLGYIRGTYYHKVFIIEVLGTPVENFTWSTTTTQLRNSLNSLFDLINQLDRGDSEKEISNGCKNSYHTVEAARVLCYIMGSIEAVYHPEIAIQAVRIFSSLNSVSESIQGKVLDFARIPPKDRLMELDKEALVQIIQKLSSNLARLSSNYSPVKEVDGGYGITAIADEVGVSREAIRKAVKRLIKDGWLLEREGNKWFFEAYEVELIKSKPGCCGPLLNLEL